MNDKKVEMRRGIIQFESLTVVVQYLFNILKDVFISVNENKRKLKSCVYLTAGRLRTEIQQHVRKLCKTLGLVISYHVLVNPTQSGIYCTVRLTLLKLWYMHMPIHSSFYQKMWHSNISLCKCMGKRRRKVFFWIWGQKLH